MKTSLRALLMALLTLCAALPAMAHANVIISGTRVVFPAQDGEVTVRLTNNNDRPALVEAWVDAGDEHSTPDKVNTPFVITPPLFRMEAHKDQNLRIIATSAALASDRESLFWLNVLEIPPKPSSPEMTGKNLLQFAFRSRLKLFYRPAGLQGDPVKAPTRLRWKVVPQAQGYALEVHNPTAYHITIVRVSLTDAGKTYTGDKPGMVAPQADLRLPITGLTHAPAAPGKVRFSIINDYGATMAFESSLMP
ncbi:MAG TPA: fimbria/pilus periplasmic chaperone [Frateuria sp.]|uniref:fimbrial biogenesis chaperone n=1 Tax=Frateuria sp. TaxID=2211372 RepID=UPI002D7E9608|nr:fimbria/pilus periplasmic chaperone [Frateuria sp.]HET6804797.1 fimbria/pilus periplasmic chaperone [Frateuria sp.]